jgi:formylglycine-generating enzyme required for sulfatase activity
MPGNSSAFDGDPGIVQSGTAGHYTYTVTPGRGSHPVTRVTFPDAVRFANWMNNGQLVGPEGPSTTEDGSYLLSQAIVSNGTVTRKPGAVWALPNQNEWYKTAYYTPISSTPPSYNLYNDTNYYFDYPLLNYYTTPPTPSQCNISTGSYTSSDTTPVGSYAAEGTYGTYDMCGNVFQWTEGQECYMTVGNTQVPYECATGPYFIGPRRIPGVGFDNNDVGLMLNSEGQYQGGTNDENSVTECSNQEFQYNDVGFRLVKLGN